MRNIGCGRSRGGMGGLALLGLVIAALASASPAAAAACSTSTGASGCTVNASVNYTAGTLGVESSPSLYWSMIASGYDQWASGSATTLSGCAASGNATHCTGGTAPTLEVLDATGSGAGWALSEYLSSNSLPSGSVLKFNGAGGTYGYSTNSPVSTSPFASTTPGAICDSGSTCTTPTAATSCSHSSLGFTTCPSGAVTMGGTNATTQVDLYSANASTGLGAICFDSGTAGSTGCGGATPTDFYNLALPGAAASGSTSAVINLAVNSGP